MKKTEPERMMTDTELDAALAQMAEETPPMPTTGIFTAHDA